MGNAVNFLKTVWVKAHGGSNPSSCATQQGVPNRVSLVVLSIEYEEGFEGGSRFAGAKRFALRRLDYGKIDGKGRR